MSGRPVLPDDGGGVVPPRRRFHAKEAKPELSGIRIIRNPADFDPQMPAYVTALLRHIRERGGLAATGPMA